MYHTQNGLNAYKAYVALRMHFTKPEYDYFKYNGQTNASFASYQKRKDAIFFEMIGKKTDYFNYLVYSFGIYNDSAPKPLATNSKFDQNYFEMKREIESLSYSMKKDLEKLGINGLKATMDSQEALYAPLIQNYISKQHSIVFVCAMNSVLKFVDRFDKSNVDPLWPIISLKIKKLTPFLNLDRKRIFNVINEFIEQTTA